MFKKILVVAALSLASLAANAELVHTDWETQGDQKAALDTLTGLEWLKLDNSGSYANTESTLATNYDGWRLPTYSEVSSMLASVMPSINVFAGGGYIQHTNVASPVIYAEVTNFATFIGGTVNTAGPDQFFMGAYKKDSGAIGITGAEFMYRDSQNFARFYPLNNYYGEGNFANSGTFLVSDGGTTLSSINNPSLNALNPNSPYAQSGGGQVSDVSAPMGSLIGGLFLMGLMTRRQRKNS